MTLQQRQFVAAAVITAIAARYVWREGMWGVHSVKVLVPCEFSIKNSPGVAHDLTVILQG